MHYINNIVEAIGNTPLLKLNRVGRGVKGNVFVKLEHLNPSGSYKDRMALSMIEAAEQGKTWNGRKLTPGGTVVEASAGNTAPALALVCAAKGYKSKFSIYRYSVEDGNNIRLKITRAYGPEVTISSEPEKYLSKEELDEFLKETDDLHHVLAAKVDCARMEEEDPNCVWVDQIYNPYNAIGQKSMAYEIYQQLDGKIDAIGCSIGAGGTLYGLCCGLRDKGLRPELIFGVVPTGSESYFEYDRDEADRGEFRITELKNRMAAAMGLEKWISEKSIIEKMMEEGLPDKLFVVYNDEAREMANRLCKEEGIYCGMSSGANVAVALRIADRLGPGKNVVTTIVDRRDRYLSEYPNDIYVV